MTLPRRMAQSLKPHQSSKEELAGIFDVAAKYEAGAREKALDPMIRFVLGYNAALELATIVLRASGFRAENQGHHMTTFEALKHLFGAEGKEFGSYFNQCRKLRHTATYVKPITITETQADELVREVARFRELVRAWLKREHAELV